MPTPLVVSDVAKSFTMHLQGGIRLPVVACVAFSVGAGECVALAGPSGDPDQDPDGEVLAGILEAVMEGITGRLVNEGDNITMADRICALAVDHDLRQQMGVAGRERVKEYFTWERERSSLLNVMGL